MRNPFENAKAVEAPEKRDEMLEGFLTEANFIFRGLPMAAGIGRDVAISKFEELFEKSKKDNEDFTQNLLNANDALREWLQQEWLGMEMEIKVKHGGRESIYEEEKLHIVKLNAVHSLIEKIIADHIKKNSNL